MDDASGPRNPVHRTIVIVDVEGFGDRRRTNPRQLAIRAGLYESLGAAFDAAGVPWEACEHEDRGDGVFVLVPPEVPKARIAERLPPALVGALVAHNAAHPGRERIRLRVALHAGEVHRDDNGVTSAAVNLAFRLLDAPALKRSPAASPGVPALIASSWFFEDVVRHSDVLDARTFRPVRVAVKETTTEAWIARPDHPYPPDPGHRRRTAVAAAAAVVLSACALAADSRSAGPGGEVRDFGMGAPFGHPGDLPARVVNRGTGKCRSRNGPFTHPDESERVGESLYQWECADSHNPGHIVLLAPAGDGAWTLRSSARSDLCLAVDAPPSAEQRYRVCRPDDPEQVWRLRRIRGQPANPVVVEHGDSGRCLAHQGGSPEVHIQVFRRPCRPLRDAGHGWSVEPYEQPGREDCAGARRGRLLNHGTGGHPVDAVLAFRPAAPSAHGCRTAVVDPGGACLVALESAPRVGPVSWSACHDRPSGQWVAERVGEGGSPWFRLHSALDFSRCLAAADPAAVSAKEDPAMADPAKADPAAGGPVVARPCDDDDRRQLWRLD